MKKIMHTKKGKKMSPENMKTMAKGEMKEMKGCKSKAISRMKK